MATSRTQDIAILAHMPYPIARAWSRVLSCSAGAARVTRSLATLEVTLQTVSALLLPDYLGGPPENAVEKTLERLSRPSLGHWAQLTRELHRALGKRDQPFYDAALDWYFDGDNRRRPGASARLIDELVKLRNQLAHGQGAHGLAGPTREVDVQLVRDVRRLLVSLAPLARYRPFFVEDAQPRRNGSFSGHVRFLVGADDVFELTSANFSARLLPGSTFVCAPDGRHFLEVSPFLAMLSDSSAPVALVARDGSGGEHGGRASTRSGEPQVFLMHALPELERIELVDRDSGDRRQCAMPTADGDIELAAWLADRATHAPTLRTSQESGDKVFEDSALGPAWGAAWGSLDQGLIADRFELLEEIGAGGMSRVWRAHDTVLDLPVALKMLRPEMALDNTLRERFIREARTIRHLNHPNLASDAEPYVLADGGLAIRMPLLEGGSMADRIADSASPPMLVMDWAEQLLSGLATLHDAGIVHRDIKPSNILFDEDGRPVISDFGIAVGSEDERLTRTSEQLGTIAYMSPEQRAGQEVTGKSDVYALAVVLHELALGRQGVTALGRGIGGKLGRLVRMLGRDDPAERPDAHAALGQLQRDHGGDIADDNRPYAPANKRTIWLLVGLTAAAVAVAIAAWLTRPDDSAEHASARTAPDGQSMADRDTAMSSGSASSVPGPDARRKAALGGQCQADVECADNAQCSNGHCSPMDFVYIGRGEFMMGSPPGEPGRQADEREIPFLIDTPFWLAAHEVRVRDYRQLVGRAPGPEKSQCDDCPMADVSWYDTLRFANLMSARAGLAQCYDLSECRPHSPRWRSGECVRFADGLQCLGYRLPLAAEWEYAARAGTTEATYNGALQGTSTSLCAPEPALDDIAWYCADRERARARTFAAMDELLAAHSVGRLRANAWGLYDMLGNVWEWTWDPYQPERAETLAVMARRYGTSLTVKPASSASTEERVIKGGSFNRPAWKARAASHGQARVDVRARHIGFRLARTVPPAE